MPKRWTSTGSTYRALRGESGTSESEHLASALGKYPQDLFAETTGGTAAQSKDDSWLSKAVSPIGEVLTFPWDLVPKQAGPWQTHLKTRLGRIGYRTQSKGFQENARQTQMANKWRVWLAA